MLSEMTVVTCQGVGGPDVLHTCLQALPLLSEQDVLIRVVAAGINRADLLQRRGKYPPPPGASDILGMEISGTIIDTGSKAHKWNKGDRVCALLSGGGYATFAAVPESHCLPVPKAVSLRDAACLPEAVVTVYANLFESAGLKPGETVLIHGGSSGIGTTAIQMAKALRCGVFVTASTAEKAAFCTQLGADLAIIYTRDDFVTEIQTATHGRGVDVILDMVGGSYINRNLLCLAGYGRHISIATQSGAMADIDVRLVMQKNLVLTGSTLRGRNSTEKARLIAEVEAKIWPWIAAGKIKPVIYQSFPLKNAAEAHKMMETGAHMGKIVLEVS